MGWDDLCGLVGTVSAEGAKGAQKVKVKPQRPPTSSDSSTEHPWSQLSLMGFLMLSFVFTSHPTSL